MFDPRVYRAALVVVIPALILAAFSLGEPGRAVTTGIPPDAFLSARAFSELQGLAREFPGRRPGGAGDRALAARVQHELAANGFRVSTRRFSGDTVDGLRNLETVVGVRAGQSDRRIVVLAHRDAVQRPATAQLSGTEVLLELARVFNVSTLNKTLVLVSTSGGSGGGAGAADFARNIGADTPPATGPVDAVIVVGDVAGLRRRRPFVIPWSNTRVIAPPLLTRTVAGALSLETGTAVREPRGLAQLARLAFPLTVGEQGGVNAAGVPAVMVQVSGERGPGGETKVSQDTMAAFGRGVLRSVIALDRSAKTTPPPRAEFLLRRKEVPQWAARLLVGALIVPVLFAVIDAFARARRRRDLIAPWIGWTLANATPFVLVLLLAYFLALVGLIPTAPAGPLPGGAIPMRTRGIVVLASFVPMLIAGWFGLRAFLIGLLGRPGRRDEPGAVVATLLCLCLTTIAVWAFNPFAAALLVPALHVWLFALEPDLRPRRWVALALVLVTLIPSALLIVYYADRLSLTLAEIPWTIVLLVTGGHVGPLAVATWAVLLGILTSALAIALTPREAVEAAPPTTRGPLTYAGPGSLGGTESALRH